MKIKLFCIVLSLFASSANVYAATIPAKNPPALMYELKVIPTDGGTADIQTGRHKAGEEITVTAFPDEISKFTGYESDDLSAEFENKELKNRTISFKMPAHSVTLRLNFTGRFSSVNRVKVAKTQGGTTTITETKFSEGRYGEGETVRIKPIPDENFKFAGWMTRDIAIGNASENELRFTMPAYDVNVTPYFISKYSVTRELRVTSRGGGGTNITEGRFDEGNEITLYPIPDYGKKFQYWVLSDGRFSGGESLTFSMPNDSVNIQAVFVDEDAASIQIFGY